MTKLLEELTTRLEQAISEVSLLPPEEQDRIAAAVLEDMEAETAFDLKLAATAYLLDPLLRKVQADYEAGLTEPLTMEAFELHDGR